MSKEITSASIIDEYGHRHDYTIYIDREKKEMLVVPKIDMPISIPTPVYEPIIPGPLQYTIINPEP